MKYLEDYEHLELDESFYYWETNNNVKYAYLGKGVIGAFVKWFENNEPKEGMYYKGAKFYFTCNGNKFYLSFIHYDRKFINAAIKKAKELKFEKILINYGEID